MKVCQSILFIPRRLAVALLYVYKAFLSPLLPAACKYHPTCSEYCGEAVGRYGVVRGGALGFWRILRCNPFSKGGLDPVPGTPGGRDERSSAPDPPTGAGAYDGPGDCADGPYDRVDGR